MHVWLIIEDLWRCMSCVLSIRNAISPSYILQVLLILRGHQANVWVCDHFESGCMKKEKRKKEKGKRKKEKWT